MPAGAPFTHLCQRLLAADRNLGRTGRADLHLHTTASDGAYTPAQVVDLARRSGLAAIAVTDHDCLEGIAPARLAARDHLEIISGVEITCEFKGRELHLLGYFFDPEAVPLNQALRELRQGRRERFEAMVTNLQEKGIHLPTEAVRGLSGQSALGRPHLAGLLVQGGHASSIQQAFWRYLRDDGPVQVAKKRLPVERGIALVRGAGGVAAWAHPPYDDAHAHLAELKEMGLGALEVYFPSCRPGRMRALRDLAQRLGLAVTGGSDCHGPEPARRTVGAFGISSEELERLRAPCLALAAARQPIGLTRER